MTKILIVDDDHNTTQLLGLILARDGYEIASVNNSYDVMPIAAAHKPDIILLDLMMPDIDGLEVCRQLRTRAELLTVPIIFLTAAGDMDKKIAAYEAGASDFITKPVHPDELRLKIRAVIGSKQAGK